MNAFIHLDHVHATLGNIQFVNATITAVSLDLCWRKALAGKSHDLRSSFSKTSRRLQNVFRQQNNAKTVVLKSFGLKGFRKLIFGSGARFSKAPKVFRVRKAIFSPSVSKNRDVFTPETYCMKETSLHIENM